MAKSQTIFELISHGADDAEAIAAPGRRPLTFGALRQHVADSIEALNCLGVGWHDRVAIVLQQGRFAGLITRIDLLNHLRRRLKQ